MMKKCSVSLALLLFFLSGIALASAVATTVNGAVQVQRGTAPTRPLRQGDEVNQGDTVITGVNSSVVLKFDDGEVAALTANSRMAVTTYQYNPQARTGNVLLSLIEGGMRAITGLIGKSRPENVNYRAATATIGIRGSDVSSATRAGEVSMIVHEGRAVFTFRNRTLSVNAGEGVNAFPDGRIQQGTAEQTLQRASPNTNQSLNGLQSLTNVINQAAPGQPRSGTTGPSTGPGTQGGPTGGSTGGGGTASPS